MARAHARAARGAAERRPAARRRRPQSVSLLARVHGELRAPLHRRRRAPGRRLLRHDARTHPADRGGRAHDARRRRSARVRVVACRRADRAVAPVDRAREVRARARARRRASSPSSMEVAAPRGLDLGAAVAQARRFRELGAVAVNVPDYPKSGARASALALGVLLEQQGRRRDAAALLLPRSDPDRHAVRSASARTRWACATCCSRPATPRAAGDVRRRDVGLRRRRDRPDRTWSSRLNQRSRHRRPVDRRADAVSHRRRRQSVRARSRTPNGAGSMHKVEAGAEFIVTPPILDVEAFDARAAAAARARACRCSPASRRSRACATRSSSRAKSPACGSPESLLDRLRRAADERAEALAITVEIARGLRDRVDGLQITSFHGIGRRRPSALLERARPTLDADADGLPGASTWLTSANGTGLREHVLLFSRFLRNPAHGRRGRAQLARAGATRWSAARCRGQPARVVELGPGTGAFTGAIVERLGAVGAVSRRRHRAGIRRAASASAGRGRLRAARRPNDLDDAARRARHRAGRSHHLGPAVREPAARR